MEDKVDINNVVKEKKRGFTPSKTFIILLLIISIVSGSVFYYIKYSNEKALKAEQAYMADLKIFVLLVSAQGLIIERDAQGISSVWYDAIYNSPVTVNGEKAYTFNTAIKYKMKEYKSNVDLPMLYVGCESNYNESQDILRKGLEFTNGNHPSYVGSSKDHIGLSETQKIIKGLI
ncbi:hypothetical protein [Clostridium tagluense]|uniref:Uncharacterized protein n=1 Tax=Clostridium tagluense TaxID=360422 RepID=A0A401UTX5_9CLOT|nr:hypothetical protein [Clostridium tagluense]GCD12908.1 hypothetical protein Ctaglu_45310 [Clostridium tagluense]